MFEPTYAVGGPLDQLRVQIKAALARFDPGLTVMAEDVLGASARIDLLARNRQANLVAVLIAREGEDLALFTRALAHRAWLATRLPDLRKLSPGLGVREGASVGALLLAPEFTSDTLLAASSLRVGVVRLARYRQVRAGAETAALIENVHVPAAAPSQEVGAPERPPPRFRSGLTQADLGPSPSAGPAPKGPS